MGALPAGPRLPRAARTAAWIARPGPFLLRAQQRYGDVFTIRIGGEPPWVVLRNLQRPATIAGRALPAGAVVAPCIYLVHRRADLYPEPPRSAPSASSAPSRRAGPIRGSRSAAASGGASAPRSR